MQKLVVTAISAMILALPGVAADISGSWSVSGDVVGNPITMTCVFTQDGAAKVTGTCGGGAMSSTPTTGSVAGDKVTFKHEAQGYELIYSGTLDAAGTSMEGEIAVAGVTGTFSAQKAASTKEPAAKVAAAPDVAGRWTITGDVVGNPINMKCEFVRDGASLTGTCAYQDLGNSPTTGSVAGNKVTLQNHVQREQPYDLSYNGTLDAAGTSMTGDIAVAGVTGTFSGTKDK